MGKGAWRVSAGIILILISCFLDVLLVVGSRVRDVDAVQVLTAWKSALVAGHWAVAKQSNTSFATGELPSDSAYVGLRQGGRFHYSCVD
jgi:hypothetical protein